MALNAAYTPAPSGRRVCGTASALPPANRGGGHTPLMDRGSQLDTAAPHAAPPESAWREAESSVGWAVRRVARPWASMDNTRELGWMLA